MNILNITFLCTYFGIICDMEVTAMPTPPEYLYIMLIIFIHKAGFILLQQLEDDHH